MNMLYDIESVESDTELLEESMENRVYFWFNASEDESHEYFDMNKRSICQSFIREIVKPLKDIQWPLLFEVEGEQRIKINHYIIDKLLLHLAHVSGNSELLNSEDVDYEGSFVHWYKSILVIPDLSIRILDEGKCANRTTLGSSSSSSRRMPDIFTEFNEISIMSVNKLTDELEADYCQKSQK